MMNVFDEDGNEIGQVDVDEQFVVKQGWITLPCRIDIGTIGEVTLTVRTMFDSRKRQTFKALVVDRCDVDSMKQCHRFTPRGRQATRRASDPAQGAVSGTLRPE